MKKQHPQKEVEQFWDKFTTKHPGKIFTILPDNLYAKRAAAHHKKERDAGSPQAQNAMASYEEAVDACQEKVRKIVRDCRRINQKYRGKGPVTQANSQDRLLTASPLRSPL